MTALIAYRSPAGRVAAFRRVDGVKVERHEPGSAAGNAWARMRSEGALLIDGAAWLDAEPGSAMEPGSEPEKRNETMAKKTTENNEVKPKVKRPRAGCWTPVVRTFPIPGTDFTIDVEMYRVEYCGEVMEVQRNREGVKKAGAWIRSIKNQGNLKMKVERLRLALLVLSQEADEETAGRLKGAAEMLSEDAGGDGAE